MREALGVCLGSVDGRKHTDPRYSAWGDDVPPNNMTLLLLTVSNSPSPSSLVPFENQCHSFTPVHSTGANLGFYTWPVLKYNSNSCLSLVWDAKYHSVGGL